MAKGAEAARAIQREARALGFQSFGITDAETLKQSAAPRALRDFLDKEYHGEMDWMEARRNLREDPRRLMPSLKSILVLGMNYGPDTNPLPELEKRQKGVISVYARGEDYHKIIKKKMKRLGHFMECRFGAEVKSFVDTAPIMEKPLAQAAGLGWQGKHTNLVARDFGSWMFLGVLLSDMALPLSKPHGDHCGTCRACLDICPTNAFPKPFQIDARRCISYLTIEYKGVLPKAFRKAMGNRIYGCDDCLAVCPWNKFAKRANEMAFHEDDARDKMTLADYAAMGEARFREYFRASAVKRIGWNSFLRNVLTAIGNSGDASLKESLLPHLASEALPVRAAAIWALRQILSAQDFEKLRRAHSSRERAPQILEEWKD